MPASDLESRVAGAKVTRAKVAAAPDLYKGVTEREWRQTVLDAAKVHGWRVYFTWNSIHSPKGFPDLVLVRVRANESPISGRVIYAELKTEKGKQTMEQSEWQVELEACQQEYYLWRPHHVDEVHQVLR